MNFNSMEYFMTLAREKNFTRAAECLHITQQSLSSHIASLEEELGSKLVIRQVPLKLTYGGEVFLRYAEEFSRREETMRKEFCDITGNQSGVLKLGIAITRGRTIMPQLIENFQKQYPDISIELSEAPNDELLNLLKKNEIDLAIANFPENIAGIELKDFYKEEVALFLPEQTVKTLYGADYEHVIENVKHGEFSILKECPVVMGNALDIAGNIGEQIFKKAGICPPVKARSGNMETLLSLCVRGIGACFCPVNLAEAVLTEAEMQKLIRISLGGAGEYQIRFGYRKQSYQWKVLLGFMEMAKLDVAALQQKQERA